MEDSFSTPTLVILDYEEVLKDPSETHSLHEKLERAYGVGSLGIVAIRNVPDFCETKLALLPQAHSLVHLPSDYIEEQLEDVTSLYNAGYSFGKEKLGDVPDTSKASFYFNPLTDTPGSAQDRAKYPTSYPCNKWPSQKLPELEPAAKKLGCLMKNVVVELAKHIDAFAKKKVPTYREGQLYQAMKNTDKAKGRLLYYFPLLTAVDKEDSWIGWHNDSGFLTALAGDLYLNHETGTLLENPDPKAGLYVVNRDNTVQSVKIPADCMAVQLGECVQILTGGAVVATPHCVRGTCVQGTARISLPCFIDTPPGFRLEVPEGCSREETLVDCKRVPPLSLRWTENGMTFGDFLTKTFSTYYEWSAK
jgi:isopenicillin N synthase-like dioxygenase